MATSILTELPPDISESIQRIKDNIKTIKTNPSPNLNAARSAMGIPFYAFIDLYDQSKDVDMTGIKLLLNENEMNQEMEKLSYVFVLFYILSDSIVTLGRGREDADKTHQTDFGKQDNTTPTLYRITLLTYKHSWELLINYINNLTSVHVDQNHCKEIYKYIALLTLSLGVPPDIYTDFLEWTKADADADVFTKSLNLGSKDQDDPSISRFGPEITTIWQLINFLKRDPKWTLYILMEKSKDFEKWNKAKPEFKTWLFDPDPKTFKFSYIKGTKDQFTYLNGTNGDNAHFLIQNINTFGRKAKDFVEKIPGFDAATEMTQIQNFVLPQSRIVNQGKGGDEAFLESRRAGDQLLGMKILLEILHNNWISDNSSENLENFIGSKKVSTRHDVPNIKQEMSAQTLKILLRNIVYIFLDLLIDNNIEKKLTGSGPWAVSTILTQQQRIFRDVAYSNNTNIEKVLVQLKHIYKNQGEKEKKRILEDPTIKNLQLAFDTSISSISNIQNKLDITTLYDEDDKIADCVLKGLQLLYEVKKHYQDSDKEREKVIDVLVKPQGTAMDEYDIKIIEDPIKLATEQLNKLIDNFNGDLEPPEPVSFGTWAAQQSDGSVILPTESWAAQGTEIAEKAIKSYESSEEKAVILENIKHGFQEYRRTENFIIQMLNNTATIETALDILKRARHGSVPGFDPERAREIIEELAGRRKPSSILNLKNLMKLLTIIRKSAEEKQYKLWLEITKYNDIVKDTIDPSELRVGEEITSCYKKLNEATTSLIKDIGEIEKALIRQSSREEGSVAAKVDPSITVSAEEQPLLFSIFIKKIDNFFQAVVDQKEQQGHKEWQEQNGNFKEYFKKLINELVYRNYIKLLNDKQRKVASMYFLHYEIAEAATVKLKKDMGGSIQLDKKYFNTLQSEIFEESGNSKFKSKFDSIKNHFNALSFQYLMLLAYLDVAEAPKRTRRELVRQEDFSGIWARQAMKSETNPPLKRSKSTGGRRNYKKFKKNTKKIKLNKKTKKIKQKDFKNNKKKTKQKDSKYNKKKTKKMKIIKKK